MAADTGIEWAHDTANPWWGCEHAKDEDGRVRRACAHCYAEAWSSRFGKSLWGKGAARELRLEAWEKEIRRAANRSDREGRPRRVFIASMADLFEDRADLRDARAQVFEVLHRYSGRITPLLLTKRPQVAVAELDRLGWPDGAWLGVSVENMAAQLEMLPAAATHKAKSGAKVFVSAEPLAGPLHLPAHHVGLVDWLIAGGESGRLARPTHADLYRQLRDWCVRNGVPFFFKQWGRWAPLTQLPADVVLPDGARRASVDALGRLNSGSGPVQAALGKKKTGALLDGREWKQLPAGWQP